VAHQIGKDAMQKEWIIVAVRQNAVGQRVPWTVEEGEPDEDKIALLTKQEAHDLADTHSLLKVSSPV